VRSLLLVAPAVFRSVKFIHERQSTSAQGHSSVLFKASSSRKMSAFDRVINLIDRFQILVAETKFYPDPELDGSALVREFNRDAGEYRMEKLYKAFPFDILYMEWRAIMSRNWTVCVLCHKRSRMHWISPTFIG
jgi:hypothetical protein